MTDLLEISEEMRLSHFNYTFRELIRINLKIT